MKNRQLLATSVLFSVLSLAGATALAQQGMPPMPSMGSSSSGGGMQRGSMGDSSGGMSAGREGGREGMNGMTMNGMPGMSGMSSTSGMSGMSCMPAMGNMSRMGGMGGMGGMMSPSPMMAGIDQALTPRQRMRMHGEIMQAIGQIMQKYADQPAPDSD